MIPISEIINDLNTELNAIANGVTFNIVPDGGRYRKPKRVQNTVTEYIQGTARIVNSEIVPVRGLGIVSETVSVEIEVPVNIGTAENPENDITASTAPVLNALTEYLTKSRVSQMKDESGVVYSVASYGSQPAAGDILQRDAVGCSITYDFTIFYSFIQNGINSFGVTLTFEGEEVPYTELTVTRTPSMDGGAFSDTDGTARNYVSVCALQIDVSVPALTDSTLTSEFLSFLLTGAETVYSVMLTVNGVTETLDMIFAQSNAAISGVDNMGLSITLVQPLEDDSDGTV